MECADGCVDCKGYGYRMLMKMGWKGHGADDKSQEKAEAKEKFDAKENASQNAKENARALPLSKEGRKGGHAIITLGSHG